MKRSALLCGALVVVAASTAQAQLTMQMSNGWAFSFSGNVNAFFVYTHTTACSGDLGVAACGGLISPAVDKDAIRMTTGLLPAFATFEAKGKEGPVDLGVHFGFAPQIQNLNRLHDNFGNGTQAGAQIDMRQVYLTAGGTWGQILAGRELGVFLRQNILTDHTLFGVGLAPDPNSGGTSLGHIGTGYVYPNFVPQFTYSSPATNPAQFTIGLFSPNRITGTSTLYSATKVPRVEAEFTYTGRFGAAPAEGSAGGDKFMFWANGMWQHTDTAQAAGAATDQRVGFGGIGGTTNSSVESYGLGGGVKVDVSGFTLTGSGYWGKAIGDVLLFNNAVDGAGNARDSYGFLGQVGYAFPNTKWSAIGSYGESDLKATSEEQGGGSGAKTVNRSIVGDLTYQWTKSIRWVFEYTFGQSKNNGTGGGSESIKSHQGAVGMMLFF